MGEYGLCRGLQNGEEWLVSYDCSGGCISLLNPMAFYVACVKCTLLGFEPIWQRTRGAMAPIFGWKTRDQIREPGLPGYLKMEKDHKCLVPSNADN